MWELIQFFNGVAVSLEYHTDFDQCQLIAYALNFLNDGTSPVVCVVTL